MYDQPDFLWEVWTYITLEILNMTTVTEQITLAGLRQQAQRLKIPEFSKMRKEELLKAISKVQTNE